MFVLNRQPLYDVDVEKFESRYNYKGFPAFGLRSQEIQRNSDLLSLVLLSGLGVEVTGNLCYKLLYQRDWRKFGSRLLHSFAVFGGIFLLVPTYTTFASLKLSYEDRENWTYQQISTAYVLLNGYASLNTPSEEE